jgi:hypothetical protein
MVQPVPDGGGKALGNNPQGAIIGSPCENHIAPVAPPVFSKIGTLEKFFDNLRPSVL